MHTNSNVKSTNAELLLTITVTYIMQVSVLRVDLADFDQQAGHAVYSAFAIGSEQEGYSLKILGQYSGDAGEISNILAVVQLSRV